jgi:hypothetical protein
LQKICEGTEKGNVFAGKNEHSYMILYIQMKNILNYIYILSLYMLKLELPGRTNITRKTCYKKFEDNENQGVKK